MGGPKDRRIIIVKNWQLVIGVLVLAGQIIFNYAVRSAQADETARRVHALEEKRFLDWDTFENYYKSLVSQLNRIEDNQRKSQ